MTKARTGYGVDYGQSYTDKKTQSKMMKFLANSNRLMASGGRVRRLGAKKPNTQLNKDAKPKNDFFDNKRLKTASKGLAKGSNFDERQSEKPMRIGKRNETQDNKMGPRITRKAIPRKNRAGYDRRYK